LAGESGYAQAGVKVSQHTQPPFWNIFYSTVRKRINV